MPDELENIRARIDALDNNVHDLLMERAELVLKIGEAKKKTGTQIIQPDREAVMIRRLLGRHKGPLPKEAIVRIWRELVGAVSLLQTGLSVAVTVPGSGTGLEYWDMAKDYFSSVLPMQKVGNALSAISMVAEGKSTFAVLPWPENDEKDPWWRILVNTMHEDEKPLRIIARLPLGDRSSAASNPQNPALVVARLQFNASGDDRTFIALESKKNLSRALVSDKAKAAGLNPLSLRSTQEGNNASFYFIELEGFITTEDEKLNKLTGLLEIEPKNCAFLGGYPTPPVYDDRVGKNVHDTNGPAFKQAPKQAEG